MTTVVTTMVIFSVTKYKSGTSRGASSATGARTASGGNDSRRRARVRMFVTTDLGGMVSRLMARCGRRRPGMGVACGTSDSNALLARVRRKCRYSVFFSTTRGRVSRLRSSNLMMSKAETGIMGGRMMIIAEGSDKAGMAKLSGLDRTRDFTLTNKDMPMNGCAEATLVGVNILPGISSPSTVAARRMSRTLNKLRVDRRSGMDGILSTMIRKSYRIKAACCSSACKFRSRLSVLRAMKCSLAKGMVCPVTHMMGSRTSSTRGTTTSSFVGFILSSGTGGMFRSCCFSAGMRWE